MQSKVGNPQVYEAGDQRTHKGSSGGSDRFDVGPDNAHIDFDSKDQRSLANRLASAGQNEKHSDENAKTVTDPLAPARAHGNEPSRGAKIDADIKAEEEELLRNKEKATGT
ncbi:hypothetical protein BDZ94DRAFT_1242906 [Collybia nuda]|uniref:Uncharacterized protein n=1 Tax=Collybia nuda TaxID=64659 RepID=A0A9P5YGT3_9AGAR|nr:hypothetical protein BDZ94DRAFT_1242906 [Collybia nuda]